MLEQSMFAMTDATELRSLVQAHGWATLVSSAGEHSPVISHLPIVVDDHDSCDQLAVSGHLPRQDAQLHELGDREVTVVVQGPNGYVSPTFYRSGTYLPTWNFVVAHLHGRPEILSPDATYRVLSATVDHFESERDVPWRLDSVADHARRVAAHVVGFRLEPVRVVGKAKLSQDKPPEIYERVVIALEGDPRHRNVDLASAMRRHVGIGE